MTGVGEGDRSEIVKSLSLRSHLFCLDWTKCSSITDLLCYKIEEKKQKSVVTTLYKLRMSDFVAYCRDANVKSFLELFQF